MTEIGSEVIHTFTEAFLSHCKFIIFPFLLWLPWQFSLLYLSGSCLAQSEMQLGSLERLMYSSHHQDFKKLKKWQWSL